MNSMTHLTFFHEMARALTRKTEGTGPKKNGRYLPYVDTAGKITIGVGRNLTDRGLSEDEVRYLHDNDLREAITDLTLHFPWWKILDDGRKLAFLDMRYNLGPTRFRTFKTTLGYAAKGAWTECARAFRQNRKYRSQIKGRFDAIARALETGTSPL